MIPGAAGGWAARWEREQAFRALISDLDVVAAIDSVGKALEVIPGEKKLQVDPSRLRLLDVAIWTYTKIVLAEQPP